jgi:hypothetical protein
LLRRLYRTISRRDYDQFSALELRLLVFAPDPWRSKELRTRQRLRDLPPIGW